MDSQQELIGLEPDRPCRGGFRFRLREVLVVVIGLLILFIIAAPHVNDAREAARRMQCQNNLKQLGIAVNTYHENYGCLPPYRTGTFNPLDPTNPTGNSLESLSGFVVMIPFLESSTIFEHLSGRSQPNKPFPGQNWGPPPWDASFLPWKTQIPYYLCPSDGPSSMRLGNNSYKFNLGTIIYGSQSGFYHAPENGGWIPNGPFAAIDAGLDPRYIGRAKTLSFRDVTDGRSNTIAFAERRTGNRYNDRDIANVTLLVKGLDNSDPAVAKDPNQLYLLCRNRIGNNINVSKQLPRPGERWADGRPYYSAISTIMPPNGPSCSHANEVEADNMFLISTASSRHFGVVNIVKLDASTVAIQENIDLQVWRMMSTRAGAEVLDASDY